jgi:hypothetical protein
MKPFRTGLGLSSVLLLTLAAGGCAHSPRATSPGIAIQRGGAWSTISVQLPQITGPDVDLTFDGTRLRGFVGGGAISVKLSGDKADGFAPSGPVNVTISRAGDDLAIDGMWNGGPAHLRVGPDGLHGSVIRRASQRTTASSSCSYNLQERSDAVMTGTSTCIGMPLQTRLEIDPRVRERMSAPQLSLLLVAVLASPPLDVQSERI